MLRAAVTIPRRPRLAAAMIAALLLTGGSLAHAATFANAVIPGYQSYVSCLSSSLCVATGYNNHSVGDVVELHNGVPGHVSTVAKTQGVDEISCPGASGCVALGVPDSGVGALFVPVNRSGALQRPKLVSLPDGIDVGPIACRSLTSCVLGGVDVFKTPDTIEVGLWNGRSLTFHSVAPPAGTSNATVLRIACSGASCDLVGYATRGASIVGFVVSISNGKPTHLHPAPGDSLYGVSCVSATLCYATGWNSNGGIVVPVNSGVVGTPIPTAGDMFGIACHGSACTAVGKTPAPAGSSAIYDGLIVTLSGGAVAASELVPASFGYSSVVLTPAGSFVAVGTDAAGTGSVVTSG